LLVAPAPLSFDVIAPVVLFFMPALVPVTLIEKLQEAFAASDPLARLTLPAVAVMVPLPTHDPLRPLGVATTRPDGNESVNATPVSGEALGLLTVKVREVLALREMDETPKASESMGAGCAITTTCAVEVLPVPPSLDVTVTGLFFVPTEVPITLIVRLHEALAASVAPAMLMLLLPLIARIVPPHVSLRPLGLATTRPDGNESVNPMPVSDEALGLLIVKIRVAVVVFRMTAPPPVSLIEGGDGCARTGLMNPTARSAAAEQSNTESRHRRKSKNLVILCDDIAACRK
jgi:hypothetical protein